MTELSATSTVTLAGGAAMPMVGFGTWQLRGDKAYEAVRAALDAGYRHLDTATMYGNEAEIGRALRDSGLPREDIFVTTKIQPNRAGRERETIAESLRHLGTGYVDLWLIHWPPGLDAGLKTWRELLTVRDQGLARAVGVSNYSPAQIHDLIKSTGEAPTVNQIPWSPLEHHPGRLAELRAQGVIVEGYSPLKDTNLRDRTLTSIAERHGVSVPQVVLRWHLEHGIVVIPKSARRERILANLDLFSFALDASEMAEIDALAAAE